MKKSYCLLGMFLLVHADNDWNNSYEKYCLSWSYFCLSGYILTRAVGRVYPFESPYIIGDVPNEPAPIIEGYIGLQGIFAALKRLDNEFDHSCCCRKVKKTLEGIDLLTAPSGIRMLEYEEGRDD